MQQSSSFAEILRTFRASRQYTQEELAERARLGLDTISALERATRVKPRKVTVTQLAGALDLSEAERAVFFAAARGNSFNTASVLAVAPPPPIPWPAGAFWGALPDHPLVARASEWDALSATLITTMQGWLLLDRVDILLSSDAAMSRSVLSRIFRLSSYWGC
jgi:transcriptional regulator with XRE-family HTH domain